MAIRVNDYSSTIACSYIVYLLLCLKDPARYYGKPPGDSIDILNIAINSAQANNVFFKGFQRRVDLSPWFQGKYETKAGHISFIKNVNVYSGHSEREAWEGYNCRTPDVEALTKNGWKTYDQLSIGEEIYTINHDTGAGQWNAIERINVFNTVDEDIVEYSGSLFNATSTMDHRWPVINRAGGRSWKTTATLTASDNIPLLAKSNGQPVEKTYSDDFVELIAWYMTEGFRNRSRCGIYQSHMVNIDNVRRIEKSLVAEFGVAVDVMPKGKGRSMAWRMRENKNLTEFRLNMKIAEVFDRIAPGRVPSYEFLNALTNEQLDIFIEVCLLADCRRKNEFAQKNWAMSEIFAYACILSGRSVSIRPIDTPGRDYKMLNVRIFKGSVVNPETAVKAGGGVTKTTRKYTGVVWCPTVENATWLSRERGSVHFTGNCMYVVLDEISGFALESTSGNEQSKTAKAVYDMYRGSVDSRFPDYGKVILLSFPRFKNDFIQQKYEGVIADKETVDRSHKFKIDDDLPDGYEGNEFEIHWEEDHIISYTLPRVFALKRPTWEVNPTKPIESFKIPFLRDKMDALARFACMPPDAIDAFFKDSQKIEMAFTQHNAVSAEGAFEDWFVPKENTRYFMHVDLARKHDHCAVALAHVETWKKQKIGDVYTEPAPYITVDCVRWWTPTKDKNVDFADVREFIVSVRQRGFDLRLVTFDRWESDDMMSYLNSVGIKSERLSVAKRHYDDFALTIHDERVTGPSIDLLREELLQLRITNNDKVDHKRSGSKDLSDAVCGAIYNAIAHTPRKLDQEIEIHDYDSIREFKPNKIAKPAGLIESPKRAIPEDLSAYLESLDFI